MAERGFARTFEALSRCRAVVGGDTGLVHLAAACGLPSVVLTGPTTPEDGFLAWPPPHRNLGLELACRPCSRHGGPACPLGDHLCMQGLQPEAVLEAALEALRGIDSQGLATAP